MDLAITTAITTGGSLAGVALGSYISAAAGRAARNDAARSEAVGLLAQVADGAAALEAEIQSYYERRVWWKVNARNVGAAVLQVGAAAQEGNWMRGAAAAVRDMIAWDAAEQARYYERVRAVTIMVNPALVRLSHLDPAVYDAASDVQAELAKLGASGKIRDVPAASEKVTAAVDRLSVALRPYKQRRQRSRPFRRTTPAPGAEPRGKLPGAAAPRH
jgi:hypothetical protein